MSENKRPNTRKNRWWRSVAAVVSTVALGIGGVAVPGTPVASAFVGKSRENMSPSPDITDPTLSPTVSTKVEATPAEGLPGETATLTFSGTAKAPFPDDGSNSPGTSNIVGFSVKLQFPGGIESVPDVDASDFEWASGVAREAKRDVQGSTYVFDFGNIGAEDSFTVSVPVKIAADAEPGELTLADVGIEARIHPPLRFDQISETTFSPSGYDRCTLIAHGKHEFHAGKYGSWLAEAYLGTRTENAVLGDPTLKFSYPDPETGQMVDVTDQVMERAVVNDPNRESAKVTIEELKRDFPTTDWRQTLDWGIAPDVNVPAESLGEIWIPSGTVVEISQPVKDPSQQCAQGARPIVTHDAYIATLNVDNVRSAVDSVNFSVREDAEPPVEVTESVTATTTVTTESVTATVTPTTVTTTPTSTAPTEVTTPTSTAPTEVTTPTSTAPTEVTTPTSTAPTEVTTPTSTAGTVTTTVGTKTVTATTTPTTVTTTPTSTAPTVTVTPTATADCDCEPTTTTKTEKVPEPVPTTIHTTTTAEAPKRSSIGDKVWEDTNGDGKEDPDEKTGVPNVPVVITDKDGNEVTRTVTDEDGNWKVDVEPGDYVVEYVPGGHTPSQPDQVKRTVTIKPGEKRDDVDLGVLPSGSVGDRVWVDEDGDGKQGENEKGLENVVVLVSREGEPTRSAVTDANGDWKIEGLNPNAEYEVRFVKPEGWEVTGKVPGSDESGLVSKVTVKPNEYNDTYDLGLKKIDTCRECEPMEPGTIGDRVWIDENGDGKEDPNEKTGVPGVTVIVKDPEGNEITRTVTDENGNWKVDVEPGDYVVEYVPGGETPSDPSQVERTITIKPGEENFDVDLGVLPSGSVGDRVWNDEDGDGKQGENEKGLENVVVLVSREGEPTRSAVTDANGDWKIEALNPNAEYDIRFVKPDGWEVTGKVPGSDESGLASKVTVKPNEYNDTYDLGLKKIDTCRECEPVKPGTIGNRVWIDLNGNGKQDPNESEGAPDVTVIVRDADGNEVTRTVTDEDGNWKVNVEPGDYEIEYRPRDWKPTDPKRVTQKVTVEEGKEYLDLDLGVQKPKPGEPTPPTDEPAPQPGKGSSTETLDRCVANAVRSPLLYLVPVALLGAFGGEIARPYMGAINEQINQINAQFQEAMRRNTPDWGQGGRGGRDNDQFAELRGQIDAANRRIAELGQDPNVQRFGTVAAGIIGLIAAGGVLYDWCSNEKGEAFTSIGGSSSKDAA